MSFTLSISHQYFVMTSYSSYIFSATIATPQGAWITSSGAAARAWTRRRRQAEDAQVQRADWPLEGA